MNEVELLRAQTQARVLELQQDVQRASVQLAYEKQQNADLQNQLLQQTQQSAAYSLQLYANLAAAQLRCEQLYEMQQDAKTQNYQLYQQNQYLIRQLDLARDEYFRVQRAQHYYQDELMRVQRLMQEAKTASDYKIEMLRQALRGAVSISAQRSYFSNVVETLLDSDCSKEALLGKIAQLSSETATCRERADALEAANQALRSRTEYLSKICYKSSVPSVAVMLEYLEAYTTELEAVRREVSVRDADVRKLKQDISELVCENKQLRSLCLEMRENLKRVGELRATVREMMDK